MKKKDLWTRKKLSWMNFMQLQRLMYHFPLKLIIILIYLGVSNFMLYHLYKISFTNNYESMNNDLLLIVLMSYVVFKLLGVLSLTIFFCLSSIMELGFYPQHLYFCFLTARFYFTLLFTIFFTCLFFTLLTVFFTQSILCLCR